MSTENVTQALFERLSVFAGGFTLEAVQAVCAADPIHYDEIPHLLAHLVDRSLVEVVQRGNEQRYRLPEERRAATQARLVAQGQAKMYYLRLATYLYDLAKQGWGHMSNGGEGRYGFEWCVPLGAEGHEWFTKQEQELDNLRGAFRWLVDQGEVKQGLALTNILIDYWGSGSAREHEGYTWVIQLLVAHPVNKEAAPSPAERADALHLAGTLTHDAELAREHFEEGLAIYRQLGHQGQIIHLASHVINAMCSMHDYTAAQVLLKDQLASARAKGKQRLVSRLVDRLAQVAYDEGDMVAARRYFEEALALCHRGGDAELIPHVWLGVARAAGAQHDVAAAAAAYRHALTLLEGDNETLAANSWPIVLALEGLASVMAGVGEVERAGYLFGAADAVRARLRTAVPSPGEPTHDRSMLQARAALSGDEYETARAAGQALSLEQAIAYARVGAR